MTTKKILTLAALLALVALVALQVFYFYPAKKAEMEREQAKIEKEVEMARIDDSIVRAIGERSAKKNTRFGHERDSIVKLNDSLYLNDSAVRRRAILLAPTLEREKKELIERMKRGK